MVAKVCAQVCGGAGAARGGGSGYLLWHGRFDDGAVEAAARVEHGRFWPADFAPAMLRRGAEKFGPKGLPGPDLGSAYGSGDELASRADGAPYAVAIEADALHLPLRAESLDLVVTAFGFRNLANYEAGLKEFYRALKPGGQLGILEFSEPGGLVGKAYGVYFRRVLPAIGRAICGKDGAYNYLPTSVENFPRPNAMVEMMRRAGFEECAWQPYTFGIVGLYTATRPTVV